MNYRIEVAPRREWHDARGEKTKKQIIDFLKIQIDSVRTRDVYTVSADISADDAARIAEYLPNPVLQTSRVGGSALTADDNGCRCLRGCGCVVVAIESLTAQSKKDAAGGDSAAVCG